MSSSGTMHKIRWLARFYRPLSGVVLLLVLLTPVQALIEATVPRMVGFTIDSLSGNAPAATGILGVLMSTGENLGLSKPQTFAAAFIALGVVAFALYALLQSTRAWTNTRLEWAFRQDAFDRATDKGPDFFQRFRVGDLVTRLTDDVAEKLSWFACSGIFRFYEALVKIIIITGMMIVVDPVLTLWTAGPLPVLILIFVRGGTLLDKRYERLQACISDVNDRLEACFSGVRVVKAYAREEPQNAAFSTVARTRREAEISTVKATAVIESLWHSVWQFGVVIVLLAGGWRVLNAGLSVGELATFLYYTVWLVFPMFDVGQFVVKWRQSAVSIGRLVELEDVPPMVRDTGTEPVNCHGRHGLSFRGVDFAFDGSDRNVLDAIDLEIHPGETLAVVGRVGAGKSWLLKLVPRLADPVAGAVELGGRDLRGFRLEALRRVIGYVPQEPELFSGSVRSNVDFGRESIDDETFAWAISLAQFAPDVERLPDGPATMIGTRGVTLSGGQKQRLAIARALASRPQILLLDDCTSALDAKTEGALWDRLHEVLPELTAVVVTHRPDTLRRADRICVLREGRVVEIGTHDELITAGGEYATIYRKYELEELVAD